MVDAEGNRSEAVTIEVIPKSEALISNQNRHPMSVWGTAVGDNNRFFKQFKKLFKSTTKKTVKKFKLSLVRFVLPGNSYK